MLSTKSILAALSAVAMSIGQASAFEGRASWDALGTTPCPHACTPTDYRVALPSNLFPNGEHCCSQVLVQYQGKSVDATFTDLCLSCAGSYNISLSHTVFAELAPLEVGTIFPVEWNFETTL